MLTDRQKQDLIEKHYDINLEYEWWTYTYDIFVEKMAGVGIDVTMKSSVKRGHPNYPKYDYPEIYFSGFSSQGDGACFAGGITDWPKFFAAHKEHFDCESMAYAVVYTECHNVHWYHGSANYCHENTLNFNVDIAECDYDEDEDDPLTLPQAAELALYKAFNYEAFEQAIEDIVKDYCRALYDDLEKEHDYLTSDEAIWGAIVASELDKPEEEEETDDATTCNA